MQSLGLDDVLVAIQENDFAYFPGKINFTPTIARDYGLRPVAIFWGVLNFFEGADQASSCLIIRQACRWRATVPPVLQAGR